MHYPVHRKKLMWIIFLKVLSRAHGLNDEIALQWYAPLPPDGPPAPCAHPLPQQVQQFEASYEAQRAASASAQEAFQSAEKALYVADQHLLRCAQSLEDVLQAKEMIEQMDKDKAHRLEEMARRVAARKARVASDRVRAETLAAEARTAYESKQAEVAHTAHMKTISTLKASTMNTKQLTSLISAEHTAQQEDRTEAVLELKQNTSYARDIAASQSNAKVLAAAAAARELEASKAALLAEGKNPYVVYRTAQLAKEAEDTRNKLQANVARNQAELAERLAKEDALTSKALAKQREAAALAVQHLQSLGRHVTEARTAAYIVDKTGMEVLDPTGRLPRVDPSQVTDMADWTLGTGITARVPVEGVRKITSRLREEMHIDDLGVHQRLVNGIQGKVSELDEKLGVHPTGSERTLDLADSTMGQREILALEALGTSQGVLPGTIDLGVHPTGMGGTLDSTSSKYPQRTPSVFESNALARAMERQQDRFVSGTPQIVQGKVFTGDGFACTPSEVLFKDFSLQTYSMSIVLTNVSLTFNSFILLPLEDSVADFFNLSYTPPGRMSAGMSCKITITFTPMQMKDIHSTLTLRTSTGLVTVPLIALIPRCAPRVVDPLLTLGTIALGEAIVREIRIVNTQALSTTYEVALLADEEEHTSEEVLQEGQEQQEEEVPDAGLLSSVASAATSSAELSARIRRITTEAVSRKRVEQPQPFALLSPATGTVPGYGSTTISIRCAPLALSPSMVTASLAVTFQGVDETLGTMDDTNKRVSRVQTVALSCVPDPVPIYLSEGLMDFKCVVDKRVYRSKMRLCNRSAVAYRVVVSVPPPLRRWIEASPAEVFVQGHGTSSVGIKYTPTMALAAYYTHPLGDGIGGEGMEVMLPIEITAVGQALPLHLLVSSTVTSTALRLSTSSLSLGCVYLHQQVLTSFTITNPSLLPLKLALLCGRREVSFVVPEAGFLVLLPGDTTEVVVAFTPSVVQAYATEVRIVSSVGDRCALPLTAEGVQPPLTATSSVVQMRSTAPGSVCTSSVVLTNISSGVLDVEAAAPPRGCSAWLTVSPKALQLMPGQKQRIEIAFSPPKGLREITDVCGFLDTQTQTQKTQTEAFTYLPQAGPASGMTIAQCSYGEIRWVTPSGEEGMSSADWGIASSWTIPLLLKQSPRMPYYLQIDTLVALPQYSAEDLVDFGAIACNTRCVRTVKLVNHTAEEVHLIGSGLNACGPFTLLRPIKPLAAFSTQMILLECLPMVPGRIKEILTLSPAHGNNNPAYHNNNGQIITIDLIVQGLMPSISLTGVLPAPSAAGWHPRSGVVDFGTLAHTPEGVHRMPVGLVNMCPFPLTVTVSRANGRGNEESERTANGSAVFVCLPAQIQLPAHATVQLEVLCRTPYPRFVHYREDFLLAVGTTEEVLTLGCCALVTDRQYALVPQSVWDLPQYNNYSRATAVVDPLATSTSEEVRAAALTAQKALGLLIPRTPSAVPAKETKKGANTTEEVSVPCVPALPCTTLVFPDPYSSCADPNSYVTVDPNASNSKGSTSKLSTGTGIGTGRRQVKKVKFTSARFPDPQTLPPGPLGLPGSYELVLSSAAKESGLWTLSTSSGVLSDKEEVVVDIMCTQPAPRSLGGVAVGCWKTFELEAVIKGGWAPPGDRDAERVTVMKLMAFVSI